MVAWGLEADVLTADLLSASDTFVFDLPELSAIAKIGRDPDAVEAVRRSVRVAEWLAANDIPAVRLASVLSGVDDERKVIAKPYPVTLWQRIDDAVRPTRPADLAPLLRRVHELPTPEFALPPRDLFGPVERWLAAAGDVVDPVRRIFLIMHQGQIAARLKELSPVLPPGPIHGDALPRNVRVTENGPILLDLDTFADDMREHDLVVMALSVTRYGLAESEYREFTTSYGWDVRDWDGYETLSAARELAAVAWVARQAPTNSAAAAEFQHRVDSLRMKSPAVSWNTF